MSLWSWVRTLTEAKEKGMGHAPIACEWDHPSSEWARGWGPYRLWLRNIILGVGFVDFMTKFLKMIDSIVTYVTP